MSEQTNPSQATPPSMAKIAIATVIALVVACVILFTVVLPAEYGIDPLGTGKALGLSDLAAATEAPPALPAEIAGAAIVPVLEPAADGGAPTVRGAFIAQPNRYKMDSREIRLAPNEGMEIKYNLKKGAGLMYSWTASQPIRFEFHGDPNVKPAGKEGTDYYETYELDYDAGKDQAHGTFIAPSAGVHGWFWENKSPNEVTIKLVTSGFYDWIFQNRDEKQSALKTMDPDSMPGHPTIPDEVLR